MTGTRRNIWINDKTSQALKDIGGGNRSKGIQIAGGYHDALVEMVQALAYDYHNLTGGDHHEAAHALLTEIAEAGKERS